MTFCTTIMVLLYTSKEYTAAINSFQEALAVFREYEVVKNNLVTAKVLKSLVENKSINIYFELNKDTPNSGSSNSVQQIYQYLLENPEAKIKLVGYADLRGDERTNKNLSKRRAAKLKDFFVKSGVEATRILVEGVGVDKSFPLSMTGLNLSKRVTIELIHKKNEKNYLICVFITRYYNQCPSKNRG